jgi:hypothetical protein
MSLENMTEDERNSLALKKLFAHPDVGPKAKRLYKQVVPDAKFADIELEDKMSEQTKALQDEITKLREEAQTRDITARRAENHQRIREAGFEPDAVEKVMTEEKIASYDTALKYMKAQNANSRPTPPIGLGPQEMPADWKEIAKNPRQWANREAYKAVDELLAKRNS